MQKPELASGEIVMGCAYIFLDEAGNFDFSAKGTRYFALTSVGLHRPFPLFKALDDYRHDCLENGADMEYFHCYDDSWAVRNAVFDLIATGLDRMRIDCLIVEKSRIAPAGQDVTHFYPAMLGHLLNRIVPMELNVAGTEAMIVITDAIPVKKKWRAVEKAIQSALAASHPVRYRILHHQSRSHYGLQIADYCCWALFRKWQKGESLWYDRIKPAVRNEFKIVANSDP